MKGRSASSLVAASGGRRLRGRFAEDLPHRLVDARQRASWPGAEALEQASLLAGERLVDDQQRFHGWSVEVQPLEVEDTGELRDRVLVLVDPDVHQPVVAAAVAAALPDDQERGGLPAPPVAACPLRREQAGHERLRERLAARLERVGDALDHRAAGEDVALGRVAVPGPAAGPREAFAPGVGRGAAVTVHDPGLALLPERVLATSFASASAAETPRASIARPAGP